MHPHYEDILSLTSIAPQWFDENAVPRYCAFSPSRAADIHASEVALAEIGCQGCGRLFRVAFSRLNIATGSIADAIRNKSLHYGDPPNIRCCGAGPTMNSEPRRVIEYWRRHDPRYVDEKNIVTNCQAYIEWKRDERLEIDIRRE